MDGRSWTLVDAPARSISSLRVLGGFAIFCRSSLISSGFEASYIVMACTVMAYIVMAYIFMACVVVDCIVMAYTIMAYLVMAYVLMDYIVMAYIIMAYVVMAYIVMALYRYGLYRYGLYSYGLYSYVLYSYGFDGPSVASLVPLSSLFAPSISQTYSPSDRHVPLAAPSCRYISFLPVL